MLVPKLLREEEYIPGLYEKIMDRISGQWHRCWVAARVKKNVAALGVVFLGDNRPIVIEVSARRLLGQALHLESNHPNLLDGKSHPRCFFP